MSDFLSGKVGFCHATPRPAGLVAATPPTFIPPPRIRSQDYLLPAESQGTHPACVAFAFSAIMQAAAWRAFGYPIQFDELALYADCKKQDGLGGDGTYPFVAFGLLQQQCEKYMAEPHKLKSMAHTQSYLASDVTWMMHRYGALVASLSVDEGWNSPRPRDGLITLGGAFRGGHAQVIDNYQIKLDDGTDMDNGGRAYLANWWGKGWGCQAPGYEGRCALTLNSLPNCLVEVWGLMPVWEDQP